MYVGLYMNSSTAPHTHTHPLHTPQHHRRQSSLPPVSWPTSLNRTSGTHLCPQHIGRWPSAQNKGRQCRTLSNTRLYPCTVIHVVPNTCTAMFCCEHHHHRTTLKCIKIRLQSSIPVLVWHHDLCKIIKVKLPQFQCFRWFHLHC